MPFKDLKVINRNFATCAVKHQQTAHFKNVENEKPICRAWPAPAPGQGCCSGKG